MYQAEELVRNHFPFGPESRVRRETGRVKRFLEVLNIEEGDLVDHLTERNIRLYRLRSAKKPESTQTDASTLRSLALTQQGGRIDLRRATKPPRKNDDTNIGDIEAAAARIMEREDLDAAAALVAVLCDVRLENFGGIVSIRTLAEQAQFMPEVFRKIAGRILLKLPGADVGRATVVTWHRARVVEIEGRPDLRPMGIRILRNQLLADESGTAVAKLLREGAILPITRRDELSPRTNTDLDWCRLLDHGPVADVLFEEIHDTEQPKIMTTRRPSRAAVRKRAAELTELHKNPEPLPPSHQRWLDQHRPIAPNVAPYWDEEIQGPVLDVVSRVRLVESLGSFKRMVGVVEKIFADAAANNRSLDPADVLNDRNINRLVQSMPGNDQTRATYRSDLRRAARFWPGTGLVEKPMRMPRGTVTAPYSGKEIRTLRRVLESHAESDMRANRAKCFFGLGVGAGVKSREITLLTADCFRIHEASGLLVIDIPTAGDRPGRSVPLLPEWDDFVRPYLPEHGELVTHTGKNSVSASYKWLKSGSAFPPISQNRLRNTWLVQLMVSPDISLRSILDMAGLVSARSLEDLVPYAPSNKTYDQVVKGLEVK